MPIPARSHKRSIELAGLDRRAPPPSAASPLRRGVGDCLIRIIGPACKSKQKCGNLRPKQSRASVALNRCLDKPSLDAEAPRFTFKAAFLRSWRNWQTHQLEGLAPAMACRFNPCRPHLALTDRWRCALSRWPGPWQFGPPSRGRCGWRVPAVFQWRPVAPAVLRYSVAHAVSAQGAERRQADAASRLE